MDKIKFNLVGDSFTHVTGGNKGYSSHGKTSQHVEWVKEGGVATFYLDQTFEQGIKEKRREPKYLWLLESKFIVPGIVERIIKKRRLVEKRFDAVFTHDQRLLALGEKFKWCPGGGFWIKEPKVCEKSKLLSMISSNKTMCEGHKTRLGWVEKLRDRVDLFGRGFHEIDSKEDGLCDYMFSVAIENGQYETYFTEKILDCFATGTIPVYLGAPDIGNHFNADGIINLTDDFHISEDLYHSKMDAIKENLEIAKKLEVLEDFLYLTYFSH